LFGSLYTLTVKFFEIKREALISIVRRSKDFFASRAR
jgi:hypothetical protein